MPFTPAHAAAALPLLRTSLPASALVIGTVAPDLPYCTPVGTSWDTHSAWWLVTTDLAPEPLRTRVAGRVTTGLRRRLRTPAAGALVVAPLRRPTTWVWLGLLAVAAVAGCTAAVFAPDLRRAAFLGVRVGGGAALGAAAVGALVWRLRPAAPSASAPASTG